MGTKKKYETKRVRVDSIQAMQEELDQLNKELASTKLELERIKREEEKRLVNIAARLHFCFVHDIVENGPLGSLAATRAAHAWDHVPKHIKDKFPDIKEHAALVKDKKVHYSVPLDPTLKEMIRRSS